MQVPADGSGVGSDAGPVTASTAGWEPREAPLVFAGSASPRLGAAVCASLGVRQGAAEVIRFSEGSIFVRVGENVRGRDAYLVQSTVFPANDAFMELLFWLDALKRASAATATVVMPYFNYAKGDKKDQPRVSIRARVCADALQVAGADRVITLDLHSPQIQGFFSVPVDDLTAMDVLSRALRAQGLRDLVVVSPDSGFVKKARAYARRLGAPLAIADKRRPDHTERAEVLELIGDVRGLDAVLVDDFVISGHTLAEAARCVLERGARSVHAAVTHGVFSRAAAGVIDGSALASLTVTDSVEAHPAPLPSRCRVVSVAPLLAEAIRRVHLRESISVLFGS